MNVNHRSLLPLPSLGLGPDVQSQTVLAHGNTRVCDGPQNPTPNIGDTVSLSQLLRKVGVKGANVGGKADRSLWCND